MDALDEASLEYLAVMMCTNDRFLQKKVIDQHFTDDAHLLSWLGEVRGRDKLYQVYRAAVTVCGLNKIYKFHETIISKGGDKAVLSLDVGYDRGFWPIQWRCPVPCIVIMHARREADGKWRIYEQIEHHTLYSIYSWSLGETGLQLFSSFIGPLGGQLLAAMGAAADAYEGGREKGMSWIAELLKDLM